MSASPEVRPPVPPFTLETARQKVRAAEDGWNTRDPQRVSLAYTPQSRWRNRAEFVTGRDEIVGLLQRKWARELDYRLIKELWAFDGNRIAVRFAYEWHDDAGKLVPFVRQRELGVRRERPDGASSREHQRPADSRAGSSLSLAARSPSGRSSGAVRSRAVMRASARLDGSTNTSPACNGEEIRESVR